MGWLSNILQWCCGPDERSKEEALELDIDRDEEAAVVADEAEYVFEQAALASRVRDVLLSRLPRWLTEPLVSVEEGRYLYDDGDAGGDTDADVIFEKLWKRLPAAIDRPEYIPLLSYETVRAVLGRAVEWFERNPSEALVDVKIPRNFGKVTVCGDTHGQLQDVLWLIFENGAPSESHTYVINGDVCDRGMFSVEIWTLFLAYKLKFPSSVVLLRGNHENPYCNERPRQIFGGGFAIECREKYPDRPDIYANLFKPLFRELPVFAVVDAKIFVVHGGIFRDGKVRLEDLRKANHRQFLEPASGSKMSKISGEESGSEEVETPDDWTWDYRVLFDAQWADPHGGNGIIRGSRGPVTIRWGRDVTEEFLATNRLQMIVRSHQCMSRRGFGFDHNRRVLTIFSASNYQKNRNKGAVAILRQDEGGRAGGAAPLDVDLLEYRPPDVKTLAHLGSMTRAASRRTDGEDSGSETTTDEKPAKDGGPSDRRFNFSDIDLHIFRPPDSSTMELATHLLAARKHDIIEYAIPVLSALNDPSEEETAQAWTRILATVVTDGLDWAHLIKSGTLLLDDHDGVLLGRVTVHVMHPHNGKLLLYRRVWKRIKSASLSAAEVTRLIPEALRGHGVLTAPILQLMMRQMRLCVNMQQARRLAHQFLLVKDDDGNVQLRRDSDGEGPYPVSRGLRDVLESVLPGSPDLDEVLVRGGHEPGERACYRLHEKIISQFAHDMAETILLFLCGNRLAICGACKLADHQQTGLLDRDLFKVGEVTVL
ncbi:hypothetical protein FOL46_002941 [Perkinsus olseni]|uniref:Serine/threonine-protein phosphatase n=1 Tax=Perkinsus olseni TaxID=32597 RepID=A0A7J6MXU9_PEROL|nr:hypothetical protein FOL46_002941 [Perkinsus olseni]